jgi:hypothetical protein
MLKSLRQFIKLLFTFVLVVRGPAFVQTNTFTSTPSHAIKSKNTQTFFDDWAHVLLVVLLSLLFGSIFTVVLFKYCKRKITGNIQTYTVEVPLGQNERRSLLYCEVDIVQFSSSEARSETAETVDTEVEPTHVESNSEDEYCYPENIEDAYETVNPVNPRQASGEYACAYNEDAYETMTPPQASRECTCAYVEDVYETMNPPQAFLNINAGNNTFPRVRPANGVYEKLQNSRSSSDNKYRYAYDWLDPGARVATLSSSEPVLASLGKDEVDDNFYENYQTLSRECLTKD